MPFRPLPHRTALALVGALAGFLLVSPSLAAMLTISAKEMTDWKAVYGRIETRDLIAARARIGGTLVELLVTEGQVVTGGQQIGRVKDDKIALQVAALDAQLKALNAQLANAETELKRGQSLVESGASTAQKLGQLSTDVDVYRNQIAATEAQRQVQLEQAAEGDVLAPDAGVVVSVPQTQGAVLLAGETVATVGSGGFFLRLAIPERHADLLVAGAQLSIEAGTSALTGRLGKIYPQIDNGRVIADVEVEGLPTHFVDRRVLVRVPVGSHLALMVPRNAVSTRSGLDFVTVEEGGTAVERSVVLGDADGDMVEVVTGLSNGDVVVTP